MPLLRTVRIWGIILVTLLAARPNRALQNPPLTPLDLVRKTVANEVSSASGFGNFMFRSRKETPRGSQTKLFVETQQATAAILIAINDQPLNRDQRRAEASRLHHLANSPEELKKKQRQEKEDAERITRIVRALPSAFFYEYDGSEADRVGMGKPGDQLIRLKFHPNPQYTPPSRVEQVLTGMEGSLLIDTDCNRIASIDGRLFKDVGFGWGILGHLDKGGRFQVEQAKVSDSFWQIARMHLNFTGKILLFKNLVIKSDETFSDFRRIPTNLTFAQGVELLEQETSTGPSETRESY